MPDRVDYIPEGGSEAYVKIGRRRRSLSEWFHQAHPIVRFDDGAYLEGNEYFELPSGAARQPYNKNRIVPWDWSGVDIKVESQRIEKRANSIQRRVLDKLLDASFEPQFDIIFDDDDAGEAADIVCIGTNGNRLIVHLYHCKFSGADRAGARVEDLYAVCGQTQRSVHWRADVPELFKHLRRRDESRRENAKKAGTPFITRFERGDLRALRDLAKRSTLLVPEFKIFLVQPGLSKAAANNKQLELLGVTDLYLLETYAIELHVIASD